MRHQIVFTITIVVALCQMSMQSADKYWRSLIDASDIVAVVVTYGESEWLVNPKLLHSGYVQNSDGSKTWQGPDYNKGVVARLYPARIAEIIKGDKRMPLAVRQEVYIILPDVILTGQSIPPFNKDKEYLLFMSSKEQSRYHEMGRSVPGKLDSVKAFESKAGFSLVGGKAGRVMLNGDGQKVLQEVRSQVGIRK